MRNLKESRQGHPREKCQVGETEGHGTREQEDEEVGIVALFRQQSREAQVTWLLKGKDVKVLDQRTIESLFLTY